jgi:hypothetical protein
MIHYNFKDATVIEGKLSTFLNGYIREFRHNGDGFQDFTDESILYGLLEYSKFPRQYDRRERIIYVHDKCLEYMNIPHYYVDVEFDEQYDCFTIMVNRNDVNKNKLKF